MEGSRHRATLNVSTGVMRNATHGLLTNDVLKPQSTDRLCSVGLCFHHHVPISLATCSILSVPSATASDICYYLETVFDGVKFRHVAHQTCLPFVCNCKIRASGVSAEQTASIMLIDLYTEWMRTTFPTFRRCFLPPPP
jgi:hypothetical protein